MRNIELAHVVVKFQVAGDSYYLLHRHRKWDDYSLVGGHVEPGEEELWARTAAREVEEELHPLHHRRDFILVPLLRAPLTWGPQRSRSAAGEMTVYTAQFFRIVFRKSPIDLLIDIQDVVFIRGDDLAGHRKVSDMVHRLDGVLRGGLAAVPPAWECSSADAERVQRLSTTRHHSFAGEPALACG